MTRRTIAPALAVLAVTARGAAAQPASPAAAATRQSLEDAWWTGPMLAPSAATLPRGHFLIEPYFYDVIAHGRFDADGARRGTPRADGFGSLAYVLYGLSDRVTVGLIPTAGYNSVSEGPNSSGIRLGDLTVQAQYALTRFREGRRTPSLSLVLQESLPTGAHDRLGDRPSDGLGSGAHATMLGLYSQTYFWLPNGRILRMRFNVSHTLSSDARVEGVSVYGTSEGFRGTASPGRSTVVAAAWEYSLTRNWVLALDGVYRREGNTRVVGRDAGGTAGAPDGPVIRLDSGTSRAFVLAPAVEYNWTRNLGVLLGLRVIPWGRNTMATVTPAVAINFVH